MAASKGEEVARITPLKPQAPIVIPPSYTTQTPSESFADPSYGVVTWHTLFSQPPSPDSELCAGIANCPPGNGHLCAHRHVQAEIYYIIEGEGEVTIDGVKHHVTKGSSVFIPSNAEHEIVNKGTGELRWFYVFPTSAFENVVYRFSKDERPEAKL
ncbi:RmlC-like cupin domain-containing protein [Penicillium sp. IBT 18751x]|nr:RmlC-like cupin domain-containing protein [Penicillium sp. IBT 18751x]